MRTLSKAETDDNYKDNSTYHTTALIVAQMFTSFSNVVQNDNLSRPIAS